MPTLVTTPHGPLTRAKVTRAKWGTYTTYSSPGLLTSPNGQTWRFDADNAGGGHYGGHLSLVVEHDDERGRRYACGQSGVQIPSVPGGRGVADRLAQAAYDTLRTALHVKSACGVCAKDPAYRIFWDPKQSEADGGRTSRGYYYVEDAVTGERLVERLEDAQAAQRWLAARGAA